jgi:hypothetical protein
MRLAGDHERQSEEHNNVERELVSNAVVSDERSQANDNDGDVPALGLHRFLEGEDSDQSTSHGKVHAHLVGWATFRDVMVNTFGNRLP